MHTVSFVALALVVCALAACGDAERCSPGEPDATREVPAEAAEPTPEITAPDTPAPDAPGAPDTIDARDAVAEAEAPPAPAPFKVMSFNLRTGFADDGDDAWKFREAIATSFLQAEVPDLLGVQEALVFQLTAVGQALPTHDWVGTDRTDTGLDEYCAVFYDRLRYELVGSGTFWLSDTPEVVGSKFSDQQLRARIVTWAHLSERASSLPLVVFNTHVDTTDADAVPERSSALIVKKINEISGDLPVVLTGDFNTLVGEPAYDILVGVQAWEGTTGALVDPWRELGLPEEGSFHGFDGVADDDRRIDWILHTPGLDALEAVVSHFQEDGHYPTDHFPVWARLQYR